MGKSEKICKHASSSRTIRKQSYFKEDEPPLYKEQYLELVDKIRAAITGYLSDNRYYCRISGETEEEDFTETLDIVRKVRYDSAFTFIYSKRTGTPAATMEDQVPEDVVKDRFDRLLKEVQTIAAEVCAVHEGTVQEVLVESVSDHDDHMVTGRLSNNILVHFQGDASMIGDYVNVKLDQCKGFYYIGEQV